MEKGLKRIRRTSGKGVIVINDKTFVHTPNGVRIIYQDGTIHFRSKSYYEEN